MQNQQISRYVSRSTVDLVSEEARKMLIKFKELKPKPHVKDPIEYMRRLKQSAELAMDEDFYSSDLPAKPTETSEKCLVVN
jgi:hypothetical protein